MSVPTISALPTAPQVTDTPTVFSDRANTFVAALSTLVSETNTTVGAINSALAGALVQFNAYQGDWSAGSYDIGDVVRNDGLFYISLTGSNTQEPPDTNWQALLQETIPTGIITMWSGSVASVPDGWSLCDGTNGTPDLRDRFVVGAGSSYAVDATGGSKDAVVVSHDHSFSASTDSAGGHSHSGSTNTAGSHSHTINEGVGSGTVQPGGTFAWVGLQSRSTNSAGSHSHSLSINSAGSHTHSVSGTVDSEGVSGTDKNLPPYYALAYIMKL